MVTMTTMKVMMIATKTMVIMVKCLCRNRLYVIILQGNQYDIDAILVGVGYRKGLGLGLGLVLGLVLGLGLGCHISVLAL